MPTEIESYAPTERTRQIIALAKEALSGVEDVRTRIRRSADAALECGRLLLEERERVRKENGHGAWEIYFESHFAPTIPKTTAWRWMRQVKYSMESLPTPSDSNQLRSAVFTLGVLPPKQHIATDEEDDVASLPIPKNSTHLGLINRFSAWKSWLLAETKGEVSDAQRRQLLKDFEPIEQFIAWLRQRDE